MFLYNTIYKAKRLLIKNIKNQTFLTNQVILRVKMLSVMYMHILHALGDSQWEQFRYIRIDLFETLVYECFFNSIQFYLFATHKETKLMTKKTDTRLIQIIILINNNKLQ